MDDALGAPSARRTEDARPTTAPRRRAEPAKPPAARDTASAADRTAAQERRRAASAVDRSEDTEAVESKSARASDEQDASAPVAETPAAAVEESQPRAAGNCLTGDTAAAENAADTAAAGEAVAEEMAALLEDGAEEAAGENGLDGAEGTNQTGTGSSRAIKTDGTMPGVHRGGAGATPGIPDHANASRIARARAEVVAEPGEQLGELVADAVHAAHEESTAELTPGTRMATPVESAKPSAAQAKAADAAAEFAEAVAEVEGVASIEPQGGADVADPGTRDQSQPRPAAPAPGTHAANVVAAANGSSDGIRFTVNLAAGSAAYASATPREEEAVLPQIVQSIRLHATLASSEARVQLRPEHLGALNITLKVENGNVTATIQANVAAVRQWIESHEASLRQALSEQGLNLTRLVVEPDGEPENQDGREDGEPRRQQHRRSWRDEDMTFEVLV